MRIKLLQVREASDERVTEPEDIAKLMAEEAKADRECMWVLHLNPQNQIIEKELATMGLLDCVLAEPREIFKKAIINSAQSIITVHNHPSGQKEPSDNDKKTWRNLTKAGKILGIPVLDNMIITPKGDNYSEQRGY